MSEINNALKITGPDAEKFLQGQLTCNVHTLIEDKPQLGALCNRKGRVIASFYIVKHQAEYYLLLPENMMEIVEQALNKYIKFSKATLTRTTHGVAPTDDIVMITPETSGQFTPHKLNYHLIPGLIDFNKGCYTGQEIIARVHYLSKKHDQS